MRSGRKKGVTGVEASLTGCSESSGRGPVGQGEEYGFYSKYHGKPSDTKCQVIQLSFSKLTPAALWKEKAR